MRAASDLFNEMRIPVVLGTQILFDVQEWDFSERGIRY